MKVWPIDPLVPRNLRLEVPEKLPQGFGAEAPVSPRRRHQRRLVGPEAGGPWGAPARRVRRAGPPRDRDTNGPG
jgi:hypothetical protein